MVRYDTMMRTIISLAAALLVLGPATSVAAPTLQPLASAHVWLNGSAPPAARGKVVIVDVFTFGCINCQHVVPELRSLYRRVPHSQLQIIGVHTPETSYEKNRAHVVANLAAQGIVWPVAIDNDMRIWNAYGITAWPTQLIFDRKGVLRDTIEGEGEDARLEALVNALLAEK